MDSAETHGEAQPVSAPADSNGQSGRRHQPLIAAFHDRCALLFCWNAMVSPWTNY